MPYRIIVADDNANLRTVFARIIQHVYPTAMVLAVSDGSAALALYDQNNADLVVTNRTMTPVNGSALIRALRTRNATLPIVATSNTPSAQGEMIAAGATVFFTKIDAVNQLEALLPTLLPPP